MRREEEHDDSDDVQPDNAVEATETQDTAADVDQIPEDNEAADTDDDDQMEPDEDSPNTDGQDDGAELVVHSLTDDGEIVRHDGPQPTAEDDDTQPISWKVVQENLHKD